MGVLNDATIIDLCRTRNMIDPYVVGQVRINDQNKRIISYGASSYGYDIRIADEFKIFTNALNAMVDPKDFNTTTTFITYKGDACIIPPNSFVLGKSMEFFRIPRDLMVLCVGKSTYARCGIIINVTPLEPEWEGFITLEVSNTTPNPAKIYANEGIAQVVFFRAEQPCWTSYKDKDGKYQGQTDITMPRL